MHKWPELTPKLPWSETCGQSLYLIFRVYTYIFRVGWYGRQRYSIFISESDVAFEYQRKRKCHGRHHIWPWSNNNLGGTVFPKQRISLKKDTCWYLTNTWWKSKLIQVTRILSSIWISFSILYDQKNIIKIFDRNYNNC